MAARAVLHRKQLIVRVRVVQFRVHILGCRGVHVLLRACTAHANVPLEFREILVVEVPVVPPARKLSAVAMEGMLLSFRLHVYT